MIEQHCPQFPLWQFPHLCSAQLIVQTWCGDVKPERVRADSRMLFVKSLLTEGFQITGLYKDVWSVGLLHLQHYNFFPVPYRDWAAASMSCNISQGRAEISKLRDRRSSSDYRPMIASRAPPFFFWCFRVQMCQYSAIANKYTTFDFLLFLSVFVDPVKERKEMKWGFTH